MAKQLEDVIVPFSLLSYEEKKAIVERIRYNKYVLKPALKKRQAKKKQTKQKASDKKLVTMLKGLSPEEVSKILASVKEE